MKREFQLTKLKIRVVGLELSRSLVDDLEPKHFELAFVKWFILT